MQQTLLLDAGYVPQRIVSWQKAVTMLFGGKVEVVDVYDGVIRSPSIAIRMPAVVRLVRVVRFRRPPVRFSRRNVLLRDELTCQYCGAMPHPRVLTLDHVVPRSRGGRTVWTNVVAACRTCNTKKGARTPAEASMTLRTAPIRPKYLPLQAFTAPSEVPDHWQSWLSAA